jgi:hypothetical protein
MRALFHKVGFVGRPALLLSIGTIALVAACARDDESGASGTPSTASSSATTSSSGTGVGGSGGSSGEGGTGAGTGGATTSSSTSTSTTGSGGGGGAPECVDAADCPPGANECETPTCTGGVCGTDFVASGTAVTDPLPGDCKASECDGNGAIADVADDQDLPDDGNECTGDACDQGVATHDPVASGAACGASMVCDGAGSCVGCVDASDCPGVTSECGAPTCTLGVCGYSAAAAGAPLLQQLAGDCQLAVCDGMGGKTTQADDGDVPVDGLACTQDICTAGVASNPAAAAGTACNAGGGVKCDAAGACSAVVAVLRVGDGAAALTSAATAVFVEERFVTDGALVPVAQNPLALPTVANGAQQALTLSGTATSEGGLTRSENGAFLSLVGYGAALGTASVGSTQSATTNRVVARVSAALAVDTSTATSTGFNGNNVRSATSSDGTGFWVFGNGSSGTGGVHYLPFGMVGGTQIVTTPGNTRGSVVFGGQLYGSSGSSPFTAVFSVGAGLPTTTGQSAVVLPGMPTMGGSPYAFALLDVDPAIAGPDRLYVADDRSLASGGGIQKWKLDAMTLQWTLSATFTQGLTTAPRGVAALAQGTVVTLVATTSETSANFIVKMVDDDLVAPTAVSIAQAAANTVLRGVAVAP